MLVGAEGAADVGSFLPLDAEPTEIFDLGELEFRSDTGRIEVVVAKDEGALGRAGALGGDPEGAGVAEVEVAGGGWGDATAVGVGGVGAGGEGHEWKRKLERWLGGWGEGDG